MKNNKFLALDLGTKMGYALVEADKIISSGTIHFKKQASKFNDYQAIILNMLSDCTNVYYEKVYAHKGVAAAHMYGAFEGILKMTAYSCAVSIDGIPVGTIKKAITARGNASKGDVINAVKTKMGITPQDDNEADALALAYYITNVNNE